MKEWVGLVMALIAALVSSAGWVLTYFAKKEEVEILSCTMDANVRVAKNTSSIQLIRERHLQLRREIRSFKPTQTGNRPPPDSVDGDEFGTIEELRSAAKVARENLKILADDSAYLVNALARKECDTREGRDRLREKMRNDPPLKD